MNAGLNPRQVRRRENMGIICLGLGALALCAGIWTLSVNELFGLTLVFAGLTLGGTGTGILTVLPDLLTTPDESY